MSNTTINSNLTTATGTLDFNALFNLTPEQLVKAPAQSTKEILDGAYAKQHIPNPTSPVIPEVISKKVDEVIEAAGAVSASSADAPTPIFTLAEDSSIDDPVARSEVAIATVVFGHLVELSKTETSESLITWLCHTVSKNKAVADIAASLQIDCTVTPEGTCSISFDDAETYVEEEK